MRFDKNIIRNYFLRLSLNQKLVAMMLLLSMSIIIVFVVLYSSAEQAIFREFEDRSTELSKAIQIAVEEVTSSGPPDVKRLENYLKKLNTKGVKEIAVISNSDKIISSTNPKDVGKWLTSKKKELIFKAQLGKTVTGEGHAYNVIIPVIVREKQYGYINLIINTEEFSALMRERLIERIIAALFVFGAGTLFIVYLARRYTKPIEEVVRAARKVAGGNLDQELSTDRMDEIGELTQSFNYMVRKLREERELEEKLRKAEHLASIGQFSTSIAHEIKNPLNFINLSIDHIKEKYPPASGEGKETFDSLIMNIKNEVLRVSRFAESFLEYGRPLDLRVRDQLVGDLARVAGHDGEHLRRQPGLVQQVGERERRQRHLLRGLQHHAVVRRHRRHDLVRDLVHRVVERRDRGDDAQQRVALRVDAALLAVRREVAAEHLPVVAQGLVGAVDEHVGDAADLVQPVLDAQSRLGADQRRDRRRALAHQQRGPVEDVGALVAREPRLVAVGDRDRAAHVLDGRLGHAADDGLGVGVVNGDAAVAAAVGADLLARDAHRLA